MLLPSSAAAAGVGGRPYVVTDPGPPPAWQDWYRAAEMLSKTPAGIVIVPPLPLYLLALGIEAWIGLLVSFFWFPSVCGRREVDSGAGKPDTCGLPAARSMGSASMLL